MKSLLVAAAIAGLATPAFAAGKKTIEAGEYTIDAAHTKVGFEIPHLVISTVEGRFSKFEGSIVIDPKIEKSTAKIDIDVASISTDNKDRDAHLASPDFFDVAKSPKMTFVAKKVSGSIEKGLKLEGDMTIKGVTKPLTLAVKYLGETNDPFGNHKLAFNAEGKLNRKDFGLTWGKIAEAGPVVGDEVTLSIKVEANKPLAKK